MSTTILLEPAFGEKHKNCDPRLGTPLCGLGLLQGDLRPKSIQIRGASAEEVRRGYRKEDGFDNQYGIFIVGEAPGRNEDHHGIPFVGESGQLLGEIIEKSGLPALDTFVTNVVRCRPPKNRTPGAGEIKACLTHLYFEIRRFKPKVLILAGRVPCKVFALDREGALTHVRGKVYERKLPLWPDGPTFQVIPTFHPAYILYKAHDEKLKSRVINDFELARDVFYGRQAAEPVYRAEFKVCLTVQDVSEMCREIRTAGRVALDTESPDLRWRTSPMMTAQFSTGKGKNWVVPRTRHAPDAHEYEFHLTSSFRPEEWSEICRHLSDTFADPKLEVYAHNAKYDMNVLERWCGVRIAGPVHDTACLHHLLNESPPHDLEYLADVEFAVGDYSAHVRAIVGKGKTLRKTYDNIPDDILWKYGATDAECCFRLGELYLGQVRKKAHLNALYEAETRPATPVFQEAEAAGVLISRGSLELLSTYYSREIERIEAECREIVGPTFNPASSDQVRDFLLAQGFKHQIVTPGSTKGYSTAKDVLLKVDHPIAQLVLTYRNYLKMRSTYCDNLATDIQDDGRVRYGVRIHGTTSGRQACSILHQIPRTNEEKAAEVGAALRALFTEDDDFELVYGDFKQIEFVIMAYEANEEYFIRLLEAGADIHAITAASVLGIEVHEVDGENRSGVGKPVNFGTVYGSQGDQLAACTFRNPRTGQKELIGDKRAREFIRRFHQKHPRIGAFQQEVLDTALSNGCTVRSRFGRLRHLPDLNTSDKPRRGHAEREAVNFKIQSAAASITTRTMIEIRNVLRHYDVGQDQVRLLFPVHDSILYGVRRHLVDWFRDCFRAVAERPIPEYDNKSFRINIGTGRTWAEAERNSK